MKADSVCGLMERMPAGNLDVLRGDDGLLRIFIRTVNDAGMFVVLDTESAIGFAESIRRRADVASPLVALRQALKFMEDGEHGEALAVLRKAVR